MLEEQNPAGVDASTDTASDGATTEDVTTEATDTADGKDYQALYENQKARAEKAEAALKQRSDVNYDPETIRKEAEAAARRTIDQQYLDELGYPDDIRAAVEKVAQVSGVSLRQAAQDGYIQTLVAEHERAERVKAATPSAGGGATSAYVFDPKNPPDVDVSTPEGQEAIAQWEAELERRNP